jgi:hypothetical protein
MLDEMADQLSSYPQSYPLIQQTSSPAADTVFEMLTTPFNHSLKSELTLLLRMVPNTLEQSSHQPLESDRWDARLWS